VTVGKATDKGLAVSVSRDHSLSLSRVRFAAGERIWAVGGGHRRAGVARSGRAPRGRQGKDPLLRRVDNLRSLLGQFILFTFFYRFFADAATAMQCSCGVPCFCSGELPKRQPKTNQAIREERPQPACSPERGGMCQLGTPARTTAGSRHVAACNEA